MTSRSAPPPSSAPAAAQTSITAGSVTPLDDASNIGRGPVKWFQPSARVDASCQAWTPLVEAARSGALEAWTATPDGTLALLLLLDQLPRNVYRGAAAAYASPALDRALDAIARGDDRRVPIDRQMFFYLPLMHTESLLAQVGCLGLYQGMAARAEPGSAMRELLDGALKMC
ncbi:hypothetical protein F4779DRAFT_622301 [Xylariaceae sp. FL0662B]|nr:hypothetical protein F4779DRAFT_622301 [Xylariaceae sp. FL0662B]